MISKVKNLSILLLLAVAGNTLHAAPLVSIGDNIDVFFIGTAEIKYNDNVFVTSDDTVATRAQDDTVYLLSPGLNMRFGRPGAAGSADLTLKNDFTIYSKLNGIDNDKSSLIANVVYDDELLVFSLNTTFSELDSNTPLVDTPSTGRLNERENAKVISAIRYNFSQKTSFTTGFQYNNTRFLTQADGRDNQSVAVPFGLLYKYSPKLDLGFGYRYRTSDADDNITGGVTTQITPDRQDHFFHFTATGELTPKLTADFKVGVQKRSSDGLISNGVLINEDKTNLSSDTKFTWTVTPKTQFRFGIDKDFNQASSGNSTEKTAYKITAINAFSPLFQIAGFLEFTNTEHKTSTAREDDLFHTGINATYTPNEFLKFSAGFTHQNNDSNISSSSYDNNTVFARASLKY